MKCPRTGLPCVWGYVKRVKIDGAWVQQWERCSNCGRTKT